MPREFPGDPYAVLGLARGASAADIKRAYRKLAKRRHPDIDKSPGAVATMARINHAYELLTDPTRRHGWDQAHPDTSRTTERGSGPAAESGARSGAGPATEGSPGGAGSPSGSAPKRRPAGAQRAGSGTDGRPGGPGQGAPREPRREAPREPRREAPRTEPTLDEAFATTIGFGKFRGRTLGFIAEFEPGYLRWIVRAVRDRPDLLARARLVVDHLDAQASGAPRQADGATRPGPASQGPPRPEAGSSPGAAGQAPRQEPAPKPPPPVPAAPRPPASAPARQRGSGRSRTLAASSVVFASVLVAAFLWTSMPSASPGPTRARIATTSAPATAPPLRATAARHVATPTPAAPRVPTFEDYGIDYDLELSGDRTFALRGTATGRATWCARGPRSDEARLYLPGHQPTFDLYLSDDDGTGPSRASAVLTIGSRASARNYVWDAGPVRFGSGAAVWVDDAVLSIDATFVRSDDLTELRGRGQLTCIPRG